MKPFLINQGKNENEDEKIWKNELDFWIIHIKIRLFGNFHENLLKKILTHFLRNFWLIESKIKMKMKKFGKISSIFGFSISKLGYMELFIKIWEKSFFLKFLLEKGHTWTEVSKGLIFTNSEPPCIQTACQNYINGNLWSCKLAHTSRRNQWIN